MIDVKKKNFLYFFTLFVFCFFYFFLNHKNSNCEELQKKTVEQYYLDGIYNYFDRNYITSAEQFEALSKNYPYSKYTRNSLVMEIFTNYIGKEYSKIAGIYEVFTKLYPDDEYLPYVMYLYGMSYYALVVDGTRALNDIVNSKQIFEELIEKFPTSVYSNLAKAKVDYLNKMQQLNDISIADFYYNTDNYIAAMRRYVGMFNIYKEKLVSEIEEQLICRIIILSKTLKMKQNIAKYKELLNKKFPNSICINKI